MSTSVRPNTFICAAFANTLSLTIIVLSLLITTVAQTQTASTAVATVRVDVTAGHEINSFNPDSALGSSIDVLSHNDIDQVYSPHIIQESLSAGWGPITYRNNSELRMAAWHWNRSEERRVAKDSRSRESR